MAIPAPRDLAGEAQTYLSKLDANITSLESLYPYQTPEQVAKAIPLFDSIYDFVGHTTLDTALEKAILEQDKAKSVSTRIRKSLVSCEAEFEISTARKMIESRSVEKARAVLHSGNLDVFYDRFIPFEWTALSTVLGKRPESVAILGSGPLPETGIWIKDWAQKTSNKVHLHHVDIDNDRLEISKKVYKSLGITEDMVFESGDARQIPKDFKAFDVIYFLLMVGSTEEQREDILYDVAARMRSGAVIITRTTQSLKTMAYAPVAVQSYRLSGLLRPIMTCHGHGHKNGMVNASVIISQRV